MLKLLKEKHFSEGHIDRALSLKDKYSKLKEDNNTYKGLDSIFLKLSVVFFKLNLETLSLDCYLKIKDSYFEDLEFMHDIDNSTDLELLSIQMHKYYLNAYNQNKNEMKHYPKKLKKRLIRFMMFIDC